MKIVIISDTHGLHSEIKHPLPKGDVLIHAGDTCNIGIESDVRKFVHWFQNLDGYDTKVFIGGNHDGGLEWKQDWLKHYINDENLSQSDCVYLEESSFTIQDPKFSRPIKFYGSPYTPEFMKWSFNVPRKELYKHWEKIPLDTDVLITHGPPEGIRDFNLHNESCGDSSLRFYVEKIKPALHVFGHIHQAYGAMVVGDTLFVNGSTCTERYSPSNKPIVVELTEVDGKIIANII